MKLSRVFKFLMVGVIGSLIIRTTPVFAAGVCVRRGASDTFSSVYQQGNQIFEAAGAMMQTASPTCGLAEPSLTALVPQSPDFPCALGPPGTNPKIVIHGEDHENSTDQARKLAAVIDASSGKYFLGVEGINFGEKGVRIHSGMDDELERMAGPKRDQVQGYEDPFAYGLTVLGALIYRDHLASRDNESRSLDAINRLNVVTLIRENPFVQSAWKSMRKEGALTNREDENLARQLDLAICQPAEVLPHTILDSLSTQTAWTNPRALTSVLRRLGVAFLTSGRAKYPGRMSNAEWLQSGLAFLSPEDEALQVKYIQSISIGWRNREIAPNIAQMYCDAKSKRNELHLIIGELHTPGMVEILKTNSKGAITIVTNGSADTKHDADPEPRKHMNYSDKPVTFEDLNLPGMPPLVFMHANHIRSVMRANGEFVAFDEDTYERTTDELLSQFIVKLAAAARTDEKLRTFMDSVAKAKPELAKRFADARAKSPAPR